MSAAQRLPPSFEPGVRARVGDQEPKLRFHGGPDRISPREWGMSVKATGNAGCGQSARLVWRGGRRDAQAIRS